LIAGTALSAVEQKQRVHTHAAKEASAHASTWRAAHSAHSCTSKKSSVILHRPRLTPATSLVTSPVVFPNLHLHFSVCVWEQSVGCRAGGVLAVGSVAANAGANLMIFMEHDPLPLGPRHFAVLVDIVLEESLLALVSERARASDKHPSFKVQF